MKTYIFILVLLVILGITPYVATVDTYTHRGSTALPDYTLLNDNGQWPVVGDERSRNGDYEAHATPLLWDLDQDGTSEIVVMNNNTLEALHHVAGSGLQLRGSVNIGNTVYDGNTADVDFQLTPGLASLNGRRVVVVFNHTHVTTYNYSNSTFTSVQTTTTDLVTGSNHVGVALSPAMSCASNASFQDNDTHCFIAVENRSGQAHLMILDYNVEDNTAEVYNVTVSSTAQTFPNGYLLHVANIDGQSSDYEVGIAYQLSNSKYIEVCQVAETTTGCTLIRTHNLGASPLFRSSDVVVNNIDGDFSNGLEFTYTYSTDGSRWDAATIENDGTVVTAGYYLINFQAVTASRNGIAPYTTADTEYCLDDYGVYFMYTQYDGEPEDNGIVCYSQLFGDDTEESVLEDAVNLTGSPGEFYMHQNRMFGAPSDLITEFMGVTADTPTDLNLPSLEWAITLDYHEEGSIDILGITAGTIYYIDDGITNDNADITGYVVDTGNDVCDGELVTLTVTYDDEEDNRVECFLEELYPNTTSMTNHSAVNSTTTPGSTAFNHLADELGTFVMRFHCKDAFHDAYDTSDYVMVVVNESAGDDCNKKGEDPVTITEQTTTEQAAQEEFDDAVESLWSTFGLTALKARSVLWMLVIIIFVGGAIATLVVKGADGTTIVMAGSGLTVVLMILGWLLGALSTIPLVILALFLAFVISVVVVTKSLGQGTGG